MMKLSFIMLQRVGDYTTIYKIYRNGLMVPIPWQLLYKGKRMVVSPPSLPKSICWAVAVIKDQQFSMARRLTEFFSTSYIFNFCIFAMSLWLFPRWFVCLQMWMHRVLKVQWRLRLFLPVLGYFCITWMVLGVPLKVSAKLKWI